MNTIERRAAKKRFAKLLHSPAIQKSLNFMAHNTALNEGSHSKMPSTERIDGIIKACRSAMGY